MCDRLVPVVIFRSAGIEVLWHRCLTLRTLGVSPVAIASVSVAATAELVLAGKLHWRRLKLLFTVRAMADLPENGMKTSNRYI